MDAVNCSIARTLEVVGEKWSLLVLREAFWGVRRFDDLQRNLGVARNVLSARLETLVAQGLLTRTPYREGGQRTRFEYRLSAAGRDLYPVLVALMQWGDRHRGDPSGPPVVLHHRGCDLQAGAAVVCACGQQLAPREVEPRPGPGARSRTAS